MEMEDSHENKPKPKPRIYCCGMQIECAAKIALILGFSLWIPFSAIVYFAYSTASDDDADFREKIPIGVALSMLIIWMYVLVVYLPIFMGIQKKQVWLTDDKSGRMYQGSHLIMLLFSLCIMAIIIGFFAFHTGYLINKLRRMPCESSNKCPEWSNRCPKNFAQIFVFFHRDDSGCKENCSPRPNEGVVERIFENQTEARLLKRKILEMAAAQHTNIATMKNEMLLESELKPYFDDAIDNLEEREANCELEREEKWKKKVLCEEKIGKLKQAFMDVYWTQLAKKQQWKMNSTFGHQLKGQITEEEIDAAFVVPYNCNALHMATAISIAFFISHLVIFAIFILSIPYFKWLDWATRCPFNCFYGHRNPPKLCRHCPMGRMKMERHELTAEEIENQPSILANCSRTQKRCVTKRNRS